MKTPTRMMALATVSAGLAFTASPAIAGPNPDTHATQVVSAAGLDLSTYEGQRLLDQRIDSAARQVCRVNDVQTGTRLRSYKVRDCLAKARASAERQVAAIVAEQQRGG